MYLLIAFALFIQTAEADPPLLSELRSDYSQQSTYWENATERVTATGTRVDRATDHFTFSVDGERSCISLKNATPKADESYETVLVFTPDYKFRLVKQKNSSAYHIDELNLLDENSSAKDVARIEFFKCLEMGCYLHAPTRAFDIPVKEILNEDNWSVESIQNTVEESHDGTPSPTVTLTARSTMAGSNYDTIQVVLLPEKQYALSSYIIRHKPDNGYQSVVTGSVSYSEQGTTSQLEKISINTHNEGNGEVFDSNRIADFDSFSDDCDDAVFTLSKYGLSDSLLKKPTSYRMWYLLTAAVTGLGCVFIVVRKFRGNSAQRV